MRSTTASHHRSRARARVVAQQAAGPHPGVVLSTIALIAMLLLVWADLS